MSLQERLQDKRENFRVSIRRSHNDALLKRRRQEIIQACDYDDWVPRAIIQFQSGTRALEELTRLLNGSSLDLAEVLFVLDGLRKLLEGVPD